MRTSLSELKKCEAYLSNNLSQADRLVFEARLILSSDLKENLQYHAEALSIVQLYHRHMLKTEIRAVQNRLFEKSSFSHFQQIIEKIFK